MISTKQFQIIRQTIDKGYPNQAIRTIDALRSEATSGERETLAVLYGAANRKLASLAENAVSEASPIHDRTWYAENGLVKAYNER